MKNKKEIEARAQEIIDGVGGKGEFTKSKTIKRSILRFFVILLGVCCLYLIRYNVYLGVVPAILCGLYAWLLSIGTDVYRYAIILAKEEEKQKNKNESDHNGR